MEYSGLADYKTVPCCDNWPIFVEVIEQNKICNSLCQHGIFRDSNPIYDYITNFLSKSIFVWQGMGQNVGVSICFHAHIFLSGLD